LFPASFSAATSSVSHIANPLPRISSPPVSQQLLLEVHRRSGLHKTNYEGVDAKEVQEDKSAMQPYAGRMRGLAPTAAHDCRTTKRRKVWQKAATVQAGKIKALELSLGLTCTCAQFSTHQCIISAVMQFPIDSRPAVAQSSHLLIDDLCRNETPLQSSVCGRQALTLLHNFSRRCQAWASRRRHARALFIILWDLQLGLWGLEPPSAADQPAHFIDTRYQPDPRYRLPQSGSALLGTLFVEFLGVLRSDRQN